MYQVLARQYRPRNFNQLVGQNHVSRALTSALERGRLHHAYLFTGTRGVGKTTIARILAKCLNCETGVTATPCEQCATCQAVNDGRFIDLIEIDAASRTKVEDTRELLDNVPYAPTQGRYKVYLIDEVHMLSTHSFNALLKTLEEPPAHVKFLFATTDPQKLPITVISRCLQFTLRPLTLDEIRQHLTQILNTEKISFEGDALWQISEAAQGSVRDALSLTDQAIAYGQGAILHQDVKEMLGLIDRQIIYDLILAIHQNQQAQVAQLLLQFRQQALDVSLVLDQLIATLHELAMMQFLPALSLRYSQEINDKIQRLAAQVSAQDLQLYYQIACKGRADLQIAVTQEQGFEMTVLRLLAFRPLSVQEMPHINVTAVAQSDLPQSNTTLSDLAQSSTTPSNLAQSDSTPSNATPSNTTDNHFASAASDNIISSSASERLESSLTTVQTIAKQTHDAGVLQSQSDVSVQVDEQVDVQQAFSPSNESEAQHHKQQNTLYDTQQDTPDAQHQTADALIPASAVTAQLEAEMTEAEMIEAAPMSSALTHFDAQLDQQMMSAVAPAQNSIELADMADAELFFLDPHEAISGSTDRPDHSAVAQDPVTQMTAPSFIPESEAQSAQLIQPIAPSRQVAGMMPQDILKLQPVALEGDWDVHKWEFWFRSSDLSPAVQELAQQGVMHGQINGASVFHISQEYQNLLTTAQQDLQQALIQQWPDTRFSVQYDALTELSPYQLQRQRKQQAFECAAALIQQEPVVQKLTNIFNASMTDIQLK